MEATKHPEPAFKPINKLNTRLHDEWIGRFCIGDKRCPHSELKFADGWPIKRTFCKAADLDVTFMDVDRLCPRRDELTRRRHAENVASKKAKARARRELDAARPANDDAFSLLSEVEIGMLIARFPDAAPDDHSDLF